MKRGDVYDVRQDPVEGSEQVGTRPAIIVSRDAINISSSVVLAVPCTTYRQGRHVFATQILMHAPEGGLTADSIAMGEQMRALSKARFLRQRGTLSSQSLVQLGRALLIALDLYRKP